MIARLASQASISLLKLAHHFDLPEKIFKLIPYWEHVMATNVIARKALRTFWNQHPQAETPLSTWYHIVSKGDWDSPADLKKAFGINVDFLGDNRVVFDIGGNKYRLLVRFAYKFKNALIKFVGTHAEYDRIDAKTV